MFPVSNGSEQGDSLLPLLFSCALEYEIRGLEECSHQLLVHADAVSILGESVHAVKKNTEAL